MSPGAATRLRAQGLGEARARDAHGAVRTALAIQAQDTRASRLGVRARGEGLALADVLRACDRERSVVRTWAMRGTLHMLAAEDVRWIVGLLGPGCCGGTSGGARSWGSPPTCAGGSWPRRRGRSPAVR